LSDKKKNYKHHPESLYTSCPSSGSTQQVESSNLSSTGIGSKIYYVEDDSNNDSSVKEKSKTFYK
jgi:hypothetical protein